MSDDGPEGLAFIFRDRFWPTVEREMRAGAAKGIVAHMRGVISSDRIMSKLEKANPAEQIYFGNDEFDSDRSPVWKLSGLDPAKVKQAIKDSPVVENHWILANDPFNWMMTLLLKYYSEQGTEQDQRVAVMFLAVDFYASLVFKYYGRKGGYQANAMAYAINSLTDKFVLKQEGSMFRALMVTAWKSHEKYRPLLRRCSDKDIFTYFINMRNRLNGIMRSLFDHYLKTLSSGAYLNQSRERYEDGEMVERSTDSGRVTELADRLSQAFVGEPASQQAAELASRMADVPKPSLLIAVNGIRAREGALVRETFQLLLEVFFEEKKAGPEDIKTRAFVAFAVALYARSNTKDGRIERIKEILDILLGRYSEQYTRTNREATKGAFRKSVYLYIVFFMQTRS